MKSRSLKHIVKRRSNGSKTVASDIDALEHLLENLRFRVEIVAGPNGVEGILQAVIEEIRDVDVENRIPLFPSKRARVAKIQRQVRRQSSRDRQRQVLCIGRSVFFSGL